VFFGFVLLNAAQAQRKESLTFVDKTYEFGNVPEEAGSVTHTFDFVNSIDRPVKILSVKTSCGCTTPGWSKEVITPGKKGYVTVKFDPKARPGFFNKTLTITTDFDTEPISLNIKGTVVLKGDDTAFRETNGNWHLVSSALNMGKVWTKDEFLWKEFEVLNAGESSITAQAAIVSPAHIKVSMIPTLLKPGEKGTIRIGYNGKLKSSYGFQSDNIEILTDDVVNPRKSFSVYATLEEFFPVQTVEEKAKAPRLLIHQPTIDMGKTNGSTTVEKYIALMNNGKKELSIRSVQPNCECLKAELKSNTIQPGKSQVLTIRFDASERKGTQQKFITLYTNDPVNPVQRISVAAYVEN